MNFEQILPSVGIRDLRYFTDAWAIQIVRRDDKSEYTRRILESRIDIVVTERLEAHLKFVETPYRALMLVRAVLRQLLNEPGYAVATVEFHERLLHQEQQFVEWAAQPKALTHLDPKLVDIYRTVLKDAWDTDGVDASEYRLLEVLRRKLGITRRDHRVIEVQLGHLPGEAGATHTVDEIEEAVRYLIKRGLVFRVQTPEGDRLYAIPDELGDALRAVMGIELIAPAYSNLLKRLTVASLRSALEQAGQPFTGTRDFLIERLIDGYVSPKSVLRSLSDGDLDAVLATLPSVRQDGTREIKVRNIVKHFDRLSFAPQAAAQGPSPVETYIKYYGELSRREQDVLRAAGVISKDLHIERRFEEATTALFTDLLGHPVARMEGANHPDGRVEIDTQRLILWDCKSCETPYHLTDRLARQFLAYTTAVYPQVASPLLVVAPDFTPDSVASAMRLKAQCTPGTEIGLITADELSWLANAWKRRKTGQPLPWEILAFTGRLTQEVLSQRIKTFG